MEVAAAGSSKGEGALCQVRLVPVLLVQRSDVFLQKVLVETRNRLPPHSVVVVQPSLQAAMRVKAP